MPIFSKTNKECPFKRQDAAPKWGWVWGGSGLGLTVLLVRWRQVRRKRKQAGGTTLYTLEGNAAPSPLSPGLQ